MLFQTTEEIQEYLPVAITFDFVSIMRFIQEAEWEYIQPLLGEAQYQTLVKAYHSDTLQAHEKELLHKCRYAISSIAYMKYIPWGQVQINSSGIQIVSNENMKTAFQWQIEDLQGSALRSGHNAMLQLELFLQENARQFPLWLNSDAYDDFYIKFITTAKEFSKSAGRSFDRYSFIVMQHWLEGAEIKLRKVLGKKLFDELKHQHRKNNFGKHNAKLIELILPALAHFTVAKSVNSLSLQVTPQGITVIDDKDKDRRKNFRSAPQEKLQILQEEANQDAEAAFQEIKEFLEENHFDFPSYPFKPSEELRGGLSSEGGVFGMV
jgi:hypothetical protein